MRSATARMRYRQKRKRMHRQRRIAAIAVSVLCITVISIIRICISKESKSDGNLPASPEMEISWDEETSLPVEYTAKSDVYTASEYAGTDTEYIAVAYRTQESVSRNSHEEIKEVIESIAERYGAVGMQVAVIEGGNVTDTYAYGWAVLGEEPMTADHKIRVASISKVAIGITAMLLWEDGIIDLDQDISEYWGEPVWNPFYPDDPITIRSMLTHTSSIVAYGDDYSTDYESVLERLTNGGFCDMEPGAIDSYFYNNYAFRVLGMTLELAAGERVDDVLQEKLYTPMGIDASFASGDILATDELAVLYNDDWAVERSLETQESIHLEKDPAADGINFAGGLTISAADLAKLVALLAADGEYGGMRLLDAEAVEQMEAYVSQPLADGTYQAQPLVYMPGLYGRDGIYFHTGSAYGVYNCISYDPVTGDGVVVLTTGAEGYAEREGFCSVFDEVNEYVYEVLDIAGY